MYEEHFGLSRPPFRITPDTSLFYDGGKRGDILGALVYAVHRGEGIVKVVGEVGSGKTMLCRMLQLELPKSVEIIYIANPSVSAEDILFVIAHELGLSVGKDASKHEVMHMLQDYLLQRHMEDKQVVLFIEEAQGMPLDTLEEIRLLSNLETDQNKLLQIILFGQPELDDNLSQQSIRQLRERITHNFNLTPLTHEEIHKYLNFRMREVGYTGPELIDGSLARKIEKHSGGLLRRINIIADKILLCAFSESTHNLTSRHVVAAVNDSNFGQESSAKTSKLWWVLLMTVVAALIILYASQTFWIQALIGKSSLNTHEILEIETMITENEGHSVEPVFSEAQPGKSIVEESVLEVPVSRSEVEVDVDRGLSKEVPDSKDEASVVNQTTISLVSNNKVSESDKDAKMETTLQLPEVKKVIENNNKTEPVKVESNLTKDNVQWLNEKLQQSREWLSQANRNSVSIQVLMRRKSAAKQLVDYLRNDWPLDLEHTYLYEVTTDTKSIYRVFYHEFDSLETGQLEINRLPESVKVNVPYLQSVYRMQNALL